MLKSTYVLLLHLAMLGSVVSFILVALPLLRFLVRTGLLVPHESLENVWCHTIPYCGTKLVASLLAGRKIVHDLTKKRKFGQMLESELRREFQRKAVGTGACDFEFHLSELVGSGAVELINAGAGRVVKSNMK